MVFDLRLVWTPMPQVTEQGLHGAQLQSLRGTNISTFLSIALDDLSPFVQALAKANA